MSTSARCRGSICSLPGSRTIACTSHSWRRRSRVWERAAGRRCARSTRGRFRTRKAPYNSAMSQGEERYHAERARIEQGHAKYRDKLRAEGKMFVRDRLKLLLDPGTEFQEDWLVARTQEAATPGAGGVTGMRRGGGKPVGGMAE